MARDNSPKVRQRQQLARKKQRSRAECDRILIVSEGSKTEPNYFDEIRIDLRLPVRNIRALPSKSGTAPINVVQYAREIFERGDMHSGIKPRAFERVYAVFDRDDHDSYFDALRLAESLDGKLRNDERKRIPFKAIASVPSFELWLLLHFEDVQAPAHRDEVIARLKQFIAGYEKGAGQAYAITRAHLEIALQRAKRLATLYSAETCPHPYTGVWDLVRLLTTLKR